MKRIAFALVLLLTVACNKPSEDNCRKALLNMQHLMGTENLNEAGFQGEVRRCKGGSTKTAVDCAIKATTLDGLQKCDFYKLPAGSAAADKPSSTTTGSAAGSGSAMASGSGSSTTTGGSAAPTGSGSSGGSAAPTGSGSSAGSAAPTGSAGSQPAAGSATTTGSAAAGGPGSAGSAK